MRAFNKSYDFAFQLHIQLRDSKPAIWRRVLVPADYNFGQLHQVIQAAFSWQGHHLHLFTLPVLTDHGIDQIQFETFHEGYEPLGVDSVNEIEHQLKDHLKVSTALDYHYDFGDDWIHDIVVEGYLIQLKRQKYPACIDGANHHAFEDIGGIWGYQHAVEILADPEHEEHKDLKAWLKANYGAAKVNKFDPTAFEAKKIRFNIE